MFSEKETACFESAGVWTTDEGETHYKKRVID